MSSDEICCKKKTEIDINSEFFLTFNDVNRRKLFDTTQVFFFNFTQLNAQGRTS
jgi:hypothetical protein